MLFAIIVVCALATAWTVYPLLNARGYPPARDEPHANSRTAAWKQEKDRLVAEMVALDVALSEGRIDQSDHSEQRNRLMTEAEDAAASLGKSRAAETATPPAPKSYKWVAIAVAAVVLLGGDDKKKSTTLTTPAPVTTDNSGTIVLTVPGDTTIPVGTDDPNTTLDSGDALTITDDTGAFSVMVPSDMAYDSASFDANGSSRQVQCAAVNAVVETGNKLGLAAQGFGTHILAAVEFETVEGQQVAQHAQHFPCWT